MNKREETRLRKFFADNSSGAVAGLPDNEVDEIIACAKEAIALGDDWGIIGTIHYEVYESRYWLGNVEVCDAVGAHFTVKRMAEAMGHEE